METQPEVGWKTQGALFPAILPLRQGGVPLTVDSMFNQVNGTLRYTCAQRWGLYMGKTINSSDLLLQIT